MTYQKGKDRSRNAGAGNANNIPLDDDDIEGSMEAAQNVQNVQNVQNDGVDIDTSDEETVQAEVPGERDLAAEYLDALQRERASFINYRRRTEGEQAEASRKGRAAVLTKLLGVVDDFDRALAAIPEAERQNNKWVEGVELIARKLHNVLDSEGITPIEAQGQPFDPNLHEAVAFEEADSGSGADTVSEVFSKGYLMNDKVLRPAMVKVTRG